MQGTQEEDTATQEPVSLGAMDVAIEESPEEVAITQELATLEPISEMQGNQEEDNVTQEPVSLGAMDVAVEESLKEFAVTQEPTTLIVNLDGRLPPHL